MNLESSFSVSAILVTTLAAGFGVWLFKKKGNAQIKEKEEKTKLKQRPEKWVLVGKVSKLIIFPIKSCQGVEVDEAVVTALGLKFRDHKIRDRDFCVVDKNGKAQTMAMFPGMCFITLEPTKKDHLIMSAPGMDSITFTFPDPKKSQEKLCRVKHDAKIKAIDCGDEVADWLSTFIGKDGLRLYYHHIIESQRTFEPYMYDCPQFEKSDLGLLHNETSYLLVAQESIDELNERLVKKSSWKNWRPTILIDGISESFAEVNWSFVRIGKENGILKTAVACYRCNITTIDSEEGILPKDGEPLKTLRTMNNGDIFADKKIAELLKNKGIMGLRLGLYLPAGEGTVIKVGDPVYAALL